MRRNRNKPPRPPLLVEPPEPDLPAESPIERDFAKLYDRLFAPEVAYASRFLPYADACCAVQDAATELYPKWSRVPLERKTEAYFRQAVQYRIVDYHRSASVHEAAHVRLSNRAEAECVYPMVASRSPLTVCEDRDDVKLVSRLVNSVLPPRCREIFIRCLFEGEAPADVARDLNIKHKTVLNQLAIGKELIIKEWEAMDKGLNRPALRALPRYTTEVTND